MAIVTGKLENSGFTPPRTDYEFGGRKLYIPKINQIWDTDDWRYFQGFIFTYNPKFIDGFSIGFIRWVQMYSALIEGKYTWMEGNQIIYQFSQIYLDQMMLMKIMNIKLIKLLVFF